MTLAVFKILVKNLLSVSVFSSVKGSHTPPLTPRVKPFERTERERE